MPVTIDDILDSPRTGHPIVMGILNVTPDSFSDGGKYQDPADAIAQGREMRAQGADVLDIGAESTRPGSERVDAREQIARLERVIPALAADGAILSIDTTSAAVARFALDHGAAIINDISAGREDGEMFGLVASRDCAIVLMHMLGEPKSMQEAPQYKDVVSEVKEFLAGRVAAAQAAGIERQRIIVDPGLGFGKRLEHNLALLAGVSELRGLGCAILVGASRKRFIGEITGAAAPADRVYGSVAAHLEAYRGGATLLRVHDVAAHRAALDVARAVGQTRTKNSFSA